MKFGTIENVAERYFNQYNTENLKKKRSYRYFSDERKPWANQDYKRFYEGIKKFNNESLANKKIAKYMGKHIDPNHVRYER